MRDDHLMHSGVAHDENPPGRGSGRYGWGSGENPNQRPDYSYAYYMKLKEEGLSDKEIIEGLTGSVSLSKLRQWKSIYTNEQKLEQTNKIIELSESGKTPTEIGRMLGVNESTIRNTLNNPVRLANLKEINDKAEFIKNELKTKKYIDVGRGVDSALGITETRLKSVLSKLESEGYVVLNNLKIDQLATKHRTTLKVIGPPGTTYGDVVKELDQIKPLFNYEGTEQVSNQGLREPVPLERNRILVRYGEEGGTDKDGTIEIRRGVKDLSLGDSKYAQVRIAVDGGLYMKGMAFYSDNIPKGYDVIYNSNKPIGTPDYAKIGDTVFKAMKDDKDNPFGATVLPSKRNEEGLLEGGQSEYIDKDGTVKQSVINKINEEGKWDEWSRNLAGQFLSKQEVPLIRRQLTYSLETKKEELRKLDELTQPTIKRQLLYDFAEDCDKAAAYLKAEALPRQSQKVILPVTSLKDNEIYAPTYRPGEHVVLIRYPHAGTFEIPELVVTDKNPEADSIIGRDASDAVGINKNVANKLSGADFDGDSVVVIPVNSNVSVKTSPTLEGLKDFSPEQYAIDRTDPKAPKKMPEKTKQIQMGVTTNLITDMQIKGASTDEIARAVRHSMVVIDAVKHDLDYRKSAKDNNINELKALYQVGPEGKAGGASTILSRAKSNTKVNERYDFYNINEKGEKVYKETGRTIKKFMKDKDGNFILDENGKRIRYDTGKKAQIEVYKMDTVDDAYKLTSGGSREKTINVKERLYADYANELKALAKQARITYYNTKDDTYKKLAEQSYAKEVESLTNKLNIAKLNSPKERNALLISNVVIRAQVNSNPELKSDKDKMKRLRTSALNAARVNVGAKKEKIIVTPKEWEAIQAGALKKTTVEEIYKNADKDVLRSYATPKKNNASFSPSQKSYMLSMKNAGYTLAQIADRFNVSPSTVSKFINS